VVGLPRHARFYHEHKEEWKARFQDPPPLQYMLSYRQRVADCMGFDFVAAEVRVCACGGGPGGCWSVCWGAFCLC
jgi:hypothetical protein